MSLFSGSPYIFADDFTKMIAVGCQSNKHGQGTRAGQQDGGKKPPIIGPSLLPYPQEPQGIEESHEMMKMDLR